MHISAMPPGEVPSATPMAHCPALRSGAQAANGRPATPAAAVTSKGPISQGSGDRSASAAWAAASASSSVDAMRSGPPTADGNGAIAQGRAG